MHNQPDDDLQHRYLLPSFPELDETWKVRAACRGMDPNLFHPERGDTLTLRAALNVCATCPVKAECLNYGLKSGFRIGIWGGTSERQRRSLPRRDRRYIGQRPIPHGTNTGYIIHLQRRDTPCGDCREAHAEYQRLYTEKRRQAS